MENYIVRIYRSDRKNPRRLIGLVEEVGVEGQRAFRNLEELWAILNPPKRVKVINMTKKPAALTHLTNSQEDPPKNSLKRTSATRWVMKEAPICSTHPKVTNVSKVPGRSCNVCHGSNKPK